MFVQRIDNCLWNIGILVSINLGTLGFDEIGKGSKDYGLVSI